MIRLTSLGGRTVVDLDAAEKLGRIEKVILDPDGRQVAGFVVARGSSIFGGGTETTLPASTVHAIGPDAVTVRMTADRQPEASLDELPRVSDLVGRKVVSEDGRFLGTVDDVLVDESDGRIIGYALDGGGAAAKAGELLGGDRKEKTGAPYLRADANLRAGQDLIVAPENAVSHDWALLGQPMSDAPRAADAPAPKPWAITPLGTSPSPLWVRDAARRDEAPGGTRGDL